LLRPLDARENSDVWKLEVAEYYLENLTKKVRKFARNLEKNAKNNSFGNGVDNMAQ
jgi:hypothetical protein